MKIVVTFNSEEGFAERTARFVRGFYHIFSFILFRDTQDDQGADSKVVRAKIGGIIGEVSTVLVPPDLWSWMASNRTAHVALAAGGHHMRLQWDKEPRGLVLINSLVLLGFDVKLGCKRNKQHKNTAQILLHSKRRQQLND